MNREEFKWAKDYFEYLDLRSKGLRQKAQHSMTEFLKEFEKQVNLERRKFINELNLEAFKTSDFNKYLPHNLYQTLSNEILNWKIEEPYNPIAFKWTHDPIDLLKSISLDPNDQVTLQMLCSNVINKVAMNQHELHAGFGYFGNPQEDLELINHLKPYLNNFINQEKKTEILNMIMDLEETAEKYL